MYVQPDFGDTRRYYDILFFTSSAFVGLMVPILVHDNLAIWSRMRSACTVEGGYILKTFYNGAMINAFWGAATALWAVPTSLSLIVEHGGGVGLSGAYLGMGMFGAPMIIACRFAGPIERLDWNISVKLWYALSFTSYISLAVLSCRGPFVGSLWLLMVAQAIKGTGYGLVLFKFRALVTGTIDKENMQTVLLCMLISSITGFGSGPIFGSLTVPVVRSSFRIMGCGLQDLNPAAYANIGLLVVHTTFFMPAVFARLPLKLHKAGEDTVDESAEIYDAAPERVKRINVALAASLYLLKDSGTSAIEVFDVLMLEIEYGSDLTSCGMYAGSAMIAAAFPLICYALLKNMLPATVNTWIHRSSCIFIFVCSFAVWPGVCPFSLDYNCLQFMWVSRLINYIFWSLCVNFIAGGYWKWASHDRNRWNAFPNLAFFASFVVEGITRSTAPFLVRSLYEHGGRSAACIFLTACEACVVVVVIGGLVRAYGKYWA